MNLYGYVWNNPYGFIDPFGFQGEGERYADWLDSKIEKARLGAQRDARNWIWNGVVNTLADLASAAPDVLRFGKGIGCALFNDQASGYDRARAVGHDALRGLTLTGIGSAAKGIGKAISKARPPKGISASDGTKVTGFTKHGVDRVIGDLGKRAGTKPQAILDALKNPRKVIEGVDKKGRPFKIFQGKDARVIINPKTGKVVSTNPLSSAGASR